MKVLIIKLGALGDVINTFPLVINVKQELHAQIHWLVAPLSFPIVNEHESVDRAIIFDRQTLGRSLKNTIKQIRQTEYDIVFDLQRVLKSGLFAMAARGKRRIGFDKRRCKEMSWLFPFERIASCDPDAHMLTQYMEFAKHLEIEHDKIAWNIPWQGESFSNLEKDNYVVLNIGATKPANRWSSHCFARLSDMIDKKTDCKVVITGGPEDKESAQLIKNRACCKIIDLCGQTSLKELVQVVDNAQCVISCDTGPMHLATALQTKLIALFGPSDPRRTGPYRGVVIQKQVFCSPCNKKKCKDPICMDNIKPEHVMEKLLQVL